MPWFCASKGTTELDFNGQQASGLVPLSYEHQRGMLALPMGELTPAQVQLWAEREAKTRPTQARLAWRLLRAFLSWCNEEPLYAPILAGVN